MAYTPVNWDESTPVTAARLDTMDTGITTNASDISDLDDGTNPVALASALTSGLTNFQMDAGVTVVQENSSETINLSFTAQEVVAIGYTYDNRNDSIRFTNTNSFTLPEVKNTLGTWVWIAYSRN